MSDIIEKATRQQMKTAMQNLEFYADCFAKEATKLREFVEDLDRRDQDAQAQRAANKGREALPSADQQPRLNELLGLGRDEEGGRKWQLRK